MRRCVLYSTAACFAISLRGNCFRWERCFHAGGAVVQFCRQFIVCWPQCSSMGSFCGTAVQSDLLPAPLFAHFFWQDRRNQIANQRSVCNLERTSNGTDETCRLRRGEECGVCEDESPKAQLQCHCKFGSSGESGQKADVGIGPYRLRRKNVCETMVGPRRKTKNTPVPVSRDESVCFVVPPLFRGQRPPSLRTDGAEAPAISAQRALYADSADVLRAPHRRSLTAKRLPL